MKSEHDKLNSKKSWYNDFDHLKAQTANIIKFSEWEIKQFDKLSTIQQRNFRRRYLYSRFNMALLANMLVGFLLVIINTVFDVQKISIKETVGKYL